MRYLAGVTTLTFAPGICNGCGRCVEVCPHGVFAMAGRQASIVDRDRCMECGACSRNCASGAIAVQAGVGCAEALVRTIGSGGKVAPECGCGGDASGCC